jgi:hypothetical protein
LNNNIISNNASQTTISKHIQLKPATSKTPHKIMPHKGMPQSSSIFKRNSPFPNNILHKPVSPKPILNKTNANVTIPPRSNIHLQQNIPRVG